MDYLNLPKELKEKGRFCVWRSEERSGRKTKVPYDPVTGSFARSNDINTFSDYEKALSVVKDYSGIGFMVSGGYSGIDIDHCVDEKGFYSTMALDIIRTMNSYTELSPSGTGVHIYFKTSKDFVYDKEKYYIKAPCGAEVYISGSTNKFLTCTGNVPEDLKFDLEERDEELKEILERYMKRPSAMTEIRQTEERSGDISDSEIIKHLESKPIWRGSWEYEYPSQSEADLALCMSLAFWTGRDEARMDSLFRKSGLMRPKWDKMHGASTYGAQTVAKAAANCRDVYKAANKKEPEESRPVFREPVPLRKSEKELAPFPVEALPPVFYEYCKAVSESTQTDPCMASIFCLTAMAAANQKKYMVKVKEGWTEPLNLFSVLCAAPSERKSPVQKKFTYMIDRYEEIYNERLKPKIIASRNEIKNLNRRIAVLNKQMGSDWDENLAAAINDLEAQLDEAKEIRPRQFYGDDVTAEALVRALGENGGVYSIISTEGGMFDNMGGKYSDTANFEVLLKAFYGETIRVKRIGRESISIKDPILTVMISCQPKVVGEIMKNRVMRGKGLLARFIFVFPVSTAGHRTFFTPSISDEQENSFAALMYKLMNVPIPDEPQILTLSHGATKLIEDYFKENDRYTVTSGKDHSDWCGKHVGIVARIAANIFVAMREKEDDTEIDPVTMLRAVEIGRSIREHAELAFSQIAVDEDIKCAEILLDKLKQINKDEVSRTELFRRVHSNPFPTPCP